MSRTGLDAATLARSLRTAAGDGSIEWVSQPIQASVLLDVADMLDDNAKMRELAAIQREFAKMPCSPTKCKRYDEYCGYGVDEECHYEREIYDRMCELGIEVHE
jgi:hypothetical protein